MTAPTPVSQTQTSFTSTATPQTTASIAVQAGDVLVAHGFITVGNDSLNIADSDGNTWTRQQQYGTTFNQPYVTTWTAVAKATTSLTVSFTRTSATGNRSGGVVEVWRGGSVGTSAQANSGTSTGAPSVSLTTTGDNSAISSAVCDWTASTGTPVWTTGAGTPTQVANFADGATYGLHSAYYADVGATGSKTVGMSAPSAQRYGIIAVEIKGTAGGSAVDGTASGATLTATTSLVVGSASGVRNATAVGGTLTSTAALLAGSASGVRNGSASGAILTAAASLIAGSATGGSALDGTATGATLSAVASLIAGTATGTASGIMVTRPITAGQFVRSTPPSSGSMALQSTIAGQFVRKP